MIDTFAFVLLGCKGTTFLPKPITYQTHSPNKVYSNTTAYTPDVEEYIQRHNIFINSII